MEARQKSKLEIFWQFGNGQSCVTAKERQFGKK